MLKSIVILTFLSFNLLFSQEAERKSLSVTVYNENLGVVKDVRTFELKKGISEVN